MRVWRTLHGGAGASGGGIDGGPSSHNGDGGHAGGPGPGFLAGYQLQVFQRDTGESGVPLATGAQFESKGAAALMMVNAFGRFVRSVPRSQSGRFASSNLYTSSLSGSV